VLGEGLQGAQAKEQGESRNPSQAGDEGQPGQLGQPGGRPSSDWVRNLGVDAQAAQWVGAFANPATLPSSQGFQVASAPIGTVGDVGYFDDSGAYIEAAQLMWPEDATGALAYSSDGVPMLPEVQVREIAQPMLPEDFRRQEIEYRNSTEVQAPRRSFTELVEMSHSPVDRYSAQEYRDAAAQYRASMGGDFRRDSIYNGLWTRAAALDGAAGGGWGQEVINDITGFATEEGLHAQAGVAIGGALGRGIGNRLGGSVDNVSGAVGAKPDGAGPAAGPGVGGIEAAGTGGVSTNGASTAAQSNSLARIAQDGHALERHGGGITDKQLLTRALTGVAPDGSFVLRNGQTVIPPSSTAFHADALLAQSDQLIRQNYLDRAIALNKPGAQRVTLERVDMGINIGRGFDRVSPIPGAVGPLQFNSRLSHVTAIYSYDAAAGFWRTVTIYPVK
jgi:hypothetical protein